LFDVHLGGYFLATQGYSKLQKIIAGGQYFDPKGLFYGGEKVLLHLISSLFSLLLMSWSFKVQQSVQTLAMFLVEHFSEVERYVMVDIHTGLGPYGHDMLIVDYDDPARPQFSTMLGIYHLPTSSSSSRFLLIKYLPFES